MNVCWQGVYPAVTAQYHDDLSIHFEAAQSIIDTTIKKDINGIFILESVGENVSDTRLSLFSEDRAIVKCTFFNEANNNRIVLSNFNLD